MSPILRTSLFCPSRMHTCTPTYTRRQQEVRYSKNGDRPAVLLLLLCSDMLRRQSSASLEDSLYQKLDAGPSALGLQSIDKQPLWFSGLTAISQQPEHNAVVHKNGVWILSQGIQ